MTSQNLKQINMPTKPIEEKINNVKTNLTEHKMDYDIVEDIKKVKENISLFEMCNVSQQKERLLKALEISEEKLPTDNHPQEKKKLVKQVWEVSLNARLHLFSLLLKSSTTTCTTI